MSIPRDHHFLPQWYLERWASQGTVVRYVRPRGPDGKLDCKRRSPKAVAYERDLYHLPDIDDPAESQRLELEFFQRIDDRAAVALHKADREERGTAADRIALSQFMVSLLHRSPSRLRAVRAELALRTDGAPYEGLEGEDFQRILKSTANRLLAMLVEAADGAAIVSKFKTFVVRTGRTRRTFLTSDRPISVSAQLVGPDAFMILPYAPNRLLILTHREEIARAFSTQDADVLVDGINAAVVDQSEEIVVAADTRSTAMIDRRFLRPRDGLVKDSIGLIRRNRLLLT